MACFVIIIGRNEKRRRAEPLTSKDKSLKLHYGKVESPCHACVYASEATWVGGRLKKASPGTAEMYVVSFRGAGAAEQLKNANTWIRSERAWLDDKEKTVYTIRADSD